jgi:FYVE/RhoGEF/PH domain-containing protein 5/6
MLFIFSFFRKLAKEQKVYKIAHEMMTSERAFVDALHLIHVIFREFVLAAAATTAKRSLDHIIPSEDFIKIFNNIGELMIFNSDLLRDFEDRIRHWEDNRKIADVIRMKGAYLKMYTTYIKDFKEMMEHFEECLDRFPRFRELVSEFESKEICHKLRLTHYMLKPVQVGSTRLLKRQC